MDNPKDPRKVKRQVRSGIGTVFSSHYLRDMSKVATVFNGRDTRH